jgi:hypothetical protein
MGVGRNPVINACDAMTAVLLKNTHSPLQIQVKDAAALSGVKQSG